MDLTGKNMKSRHYLFILAVAAMAGCQNEKFQLQNNTASGLQFTGTTESYSPETRTALDADMNVVWKQGDQLSIFVGKTLNQQFQVQNSCDGKIDGAFDPVSSPGFVSSTAIQNNVGYYPYSSTTTLQQDGQSYKVSTTLPSQQTYATNSFGSGAFPMVAVTEDTYDTNLKFKNILGALKLQIKGSEVIKSISIKGNNNEILCGTGNVSVSNSTLPSIVMTDVSGQTVVLDCGDGVQLSTDTVTNFIIALPPITFTGGFSISILATDGMQMNISTAKEKIIKRSCVLKMAPLTFNANSFNGHEYVDLGLPSGTLWGTTNLGAITPSEAGDYYAWGETQTYYSSLSPLVMKDGKSGGYSYTSYSYCNNSINALTKYCTIADNGDNCFVDNKISLDNQDDAASVNWGGSWRMPTKAEQDELCNTDNCTWTWYKSGNIEFNGIAGYKVTSKKSGYEGNYIFLPTTGYRSNTSLYGFGSEGAYSSRSLSTLRPYYAYYLVFDSDCKFTDDDMRTFGFAIRPVFAPIIPITNLSLSQQEVSLKIGESATLTASITPTNATEKSIFWVSSNESVATVDQQGKITAVESGTSTITAIGENCSAQCIVSINYLNGYVYVDLGLPSGTLWATKNIGADTPYDFGDYLHCSVTSVPTGWKIPLEKDYQELFDNTTQVWSSDFKNKGLIITGKDGYSNVSIFLPAAGYQSGSYYERNVEGHYWSSTYDHTYQSYNCYRCLKFGSTTKSFGWSVEYSGYSIRAVIKK